MSLFSDARLLAEKDATIGRLWAELREQQARPCRVCEVQTARVAYLESQLAQEREAWQAERERRDRTIDRLLESKGAEPVGPNAPKPGALPESIHDLMSGLFDADVVDGKPVRLSAEERVGS